jgi:hypothetical protein
MGELYLSSRTEVLRAMNIDTGRDIAIVGAPEDLVVWLNKILPLHTRIYSTPADIEPDRKFDILLWWVPEGPHEEEMDDLSEHLAEKGDLWLMMKRTVKRDFLDIDDISLQERTLVVTPSMDLVPALIGSEE